MSLNIDPAVMQVFQQQMALVAARKVEALADVQRYTALAEKAQAHADAEDNTLTIGRQFAVALGINPDTMQPIDNGG